MGKVHLFSHGIDVQIFRLHLFIQITSLSCVRLPDVNSTSGLHLRILSQLAVVKITNEKIAV